VLAQLDDAAQATVRLGCEHEQQHQELLLTDAKHVLFSNPLRPAYAEADLATTGAVRPLGFVRGPEGLVEIGHAGPGFAFDNEEPRHRVWLEPFELADRCITSGEWQGFVDAGGYRDPAHWLSDGWSTVQREGWTAPLYWGEQDGRGVEFTLAGTVPRAPDAPVSHVSFYEADAYARWRAATAHDGARLPSEAEWESVARDRTVDGNFLERDRLHPAPPSPGGAQLFGDVWEWTASPYVGYPRFRPLAGALGEYNGKFMCNQLVLRGGSCLSPHAHVRPTYRNFFGPATRWQMTGVRLARWR
jgi:ergothioneine biosynthesis protein EgtB